MESAVTIGLDLGKSVFQVHGVNREGVVVVQRRLTRARLLAFFAKQPACLVGMEACAAAHHWARERADAFSWACGARSVRPRRSSTIHSTVERA